MSRITFVRLLLNLTFQHQNYKEIKAAPSNPFLPSTTTIQDIFMGNKLAEKIFYFMEVHVSAFIFVVFAISLVLTGICVFFRRIFFPRSLSSTDHHLSEIVRVQLEGEQRRRHIVFKGKKLKWEKYTKLLEKSFTVRELCLWWDRHSRYCLWALSFWYPSLTWYNFESGKDNNKRSFFKKGKQYNRTRNDIRSKSNRLWCSPWYKSSYKIKRIYISTSIHPTSIFS